MSLRKNGCEVSQIFFKSGLQKSLHFQNVVIFQNVLSFSNLKGFVSIVFPQQ
jgi:hypothetical protein